MEKVYRINKGSCGRFAMQDWEQGTFWRNQCNGRSCHHKECRQAYARKRVKEITDLVNLNGLNRFITLTLDHKKWSSAQEAWEGIAGVWSMFRKRLRRAFKGIKFVCILEKHKESDYPHVHGFLNQFVPSRWISKNWEECGGGIMTDIELVRGDVTAYVTKQLEVAKYVGKDNVNIGDWVAPRKRVIWKSRGLITPPPKPKRPVRFVRRYMLFGVDGKLTLTQGEVDCILNENIMALIGETWYGTEKRHTWTNLERTLTELSIGGFAQRGSYVASNGRRQEGDEKSKGTAPAKAEDKRRNQKVDRQVTFEDWRTKDEHCCKATSG